VVANHDTSKIFKIVTVSYTKELYEKAVKLDGENCFSFSLDETRLIYRYIFLNLDKKQKLA
ncbi:putative LRR containing protein, partial [Trachipleistophora hominis]